LLLPLLWAQAPSNDPEVVRQLALRRWYDSLTLSSPLAVPSRTPLLLLLGGLGLALLLALIFQGPRALRQFVDLPGHLRLIRSSILRLRNAARTVAVLVAAVVLSWTASQFLRYTDQTRLDDLHALTATKSVAEVAVEQGLLAALTPLRDVAGLGDCLLLLVALTGLVFKLSADRWGGTDDPYADLENPLPPWTTACWGCAWLYAMYRFASLVVEGTGLPLGGCLFLEIGIVPLLMAMADGLILAWVLAELRDAGLTDDAGSALDVRGAVALWPGATLACLAVLPGRYVATGAWLFYQDLPGLAAQARPVLFALLLGWGLATIQAASLATLGLAGAAAWHGGRLRETVRGYFGVLRAEGGHLAGVLVILAAIAAIPAGLAYLVVLSVPAQSWVLAAADSYAHYVTLPVGLLLISALVELGARSLPKAGLAGAVVVRGEPVLTPINVAS
jgi:hypothetical protein